jgi:hypothetical protein
MFLRQYLGKRLNMAQVILFPNQDREGSVSMLCPSGELPLLEVARKDVPAGLPYLIVDTSDLPEDFEFFNAWETDFSNPDGFGIGHDAWFAEQAAIKAEAEAAAEAERLAQQQAQEEVENDNNQPE